MPESTQHKLDRIRPPRVQITYDVETGGAIQKKELPLVVGIMADLSGQPEAPLPKLKDRKFVEIDRDNFNDILKATAPRLALRVKNTLANDGNMLNVELRFQHLDDFSPLWRDQEGKMRGVVPQIKALADLLDARGRLNDLLAKLDGNDELDAKLHAIVKDKAGMQQIQTEAAAAAAKAKSEAEAAASTSGGPNA